MRRWLAALKNLWRGRAADRDLEAELQSYLDHATDHLMQRGAEVAEARRSAGLELGGVTQVAEAVRDVRAGARVTGWGRDLRFAIRTFRRTPLFTVSAVCVLGLGVGANTAIFGLVNAALLKGLPLRDDARVAVVWIDNQSLGRSRVGPMGRDYFDWLSHATPFDDLFLFEHGSGTMTGLGDPEQVRGLRVTTNFADFLGVRPVVGRTFAATDATDNVAILSADYWQRAFGGDPKVVGRSLVLNSVSYSVIGVVPSSATFWYPADIIVPWPPDRLRTADSDLGVFGRLSPGVTFSSAQQAMNLIAADVAGARPDRKGWGILVVPLRDVAVQYIRPALLLLLGAVGFVLLLACANVAALLLVRTLGRRGEIAVRVALGATPGRLVQQTIIEGVLLGLGGGLVGLLLGLWGTAVLRVIVPASIPVPAAASQVPLPEGEIGWGIAALAVLLSIAVSIVFSLAPIATFFGGQPATRLNSRTRSSAAGTPHQRATLVIAEAALAVVLLTGAGLMMRTFGNLMRVAPGFDPHDVISLQLKFADDAPTSPYRQASGRVAAMAQFLERVRAIPGIEVAAFAEIPPMSQDDQNTGRFAVLDQRGLAPGDLPTAEFRIVTDGYFEVMRIPLRAGRYLATTDRADAESVVVVDETLARLSFGSTDPIGHYLAFGSRPSRRIVGVVGSVLDDGLDRAARPTIYVPYGQAPSQMMSLLARTSLPPASVVPTIKRAVWSVDPSEPLFNFRRMDDIVSNTVSASRLAFLMLTAFAGLALLLAGVGMYGVTAYVVAEQTREFAVRLAIGAKRADILWLVIRGGLRQALTGLGIGVVIACVLARQMATMLYGIAPLDVTTLLVTALGFALLAAIANAIPAWRAARVDLVRVLQGV